MRFSNLTKRLLAGAVTAFLLLCQTAMAAQVCALPSGAAAETAESGHCHGVARQSGDEPGGVKENNCPARYVSTSLAKLDIPQAAHPPAPEVGSAWPWAPVRGGMNTDAPPLRAEPPPLVIVNCCLRN